MNLRLALPQELCQQGNATPVAGLDTYRV